MNMCLSIESSQRPTFLELRQKLQNFADEDYYLCCDSPYERFNNLIESTTESADTEAQVSSTPQNVDNQQNTVKIQ